MDEPTLDERLWCWWLEGDMYGPQQLEAKKEEFERFEQDNARKAEIKAEVEQAWEANRCPHCGRIDPLPKWLQL
jgi:hypothetical protein